MSTNNPYAPPETSGVDVVPLNDRDYLRKIAAAQRQVNVAVLLYLLLIPFNMILGGLSQSSPLVGLMSLLLALTVLLLGALSVFKLAAIFRGKAVAVIYALGLLVPLLGLILLLTISQKATKILKQNGIAVGLMGANPKAI